MNTNICWLTGYVAPLYEAALRTALHHSVCPSACPEVEKEKLLQKTQIDRKVDVVICNSRRGLRSKG